MMSDISSDSINNPAPPPQPQPYPQLSGLHGVTVPRARPQLGHPVAAPARRRGLVQLQTILRVLQRRRYVEAQV